MPHRVLEPSTARKSASYCLWEAWGTTLPGWRWFFGFEVCCLTAGGVSTGLSRNESSTHDAATLAGAASRNSEDKKYRIVYRGLSSAVNQFCGPGAPPPHPMGQKVRVVLRAKARTARKSASYCLWEAWGTKANKNHTFSRNEWFVLPKNHVAKNYFGVPLGAVGFVGKSKVLGQMWCRYSQSYLSPGRTRGFVVAFPSKWCPRAAAVNGPFCILIWVVLFGRFSAKLGHKTPLDRRGSSCSSGCAQISPGDRSFFSKRAARPQTRLFVRSGGRRSLHKTTNAHEAALAI